MTKHLFALMLAALMLGVSFAWAEEEIKPQDVRTMQEAYTLIDEETVWSGDGWPSYAQEYGFTAISLTPEEAYRALAAACNDGGSMGAVLEGWGIRGQEPYGSPQRKMLTEETAIGNTTAALEAVVIGDPFMGAESLLFMKMWGGEWKLIDYMSGEAEALRTTGGEYPAGAFIEMLEIGHGTGAYAEYIAVYNPMTRRCEAGYTRRGYECLLADRALFVSAWADYDYQGLRVVRSAVFCSSEQEEATTIYRQRAQEASVYLYEWTGESLKLRMSQKFEDISPALLLAHGISDYTEDRVTILP